MKQEYLLETSQFFKNNAQWLTILAIAVVGLPAAAHYGMKFRAVVVAERQLGQGLGLLAEDTIEPYRAGLASTERGCRVMLNTYFQNQNAVRLEWASQACLNRGKDIPEVQLARASARELVGRDGDALTFLALGAQKFDKMPDFYIRIGQVLQRNKRDQDAVSYFKQASDRVPADANLALATLQYSIATQSWDNAKTLASRVKTTPTNNPEVKLLLATAFMHAKDQESAKIAAEEARLLMKQPGADAALTKELEKRYVNVLELPAPPVGTVPSVKSIADAAQTTNMPSGKADTLTSAPGHRLPAASVKKN